MGVSYISEEILAYDPATLTDVTVIGYGDDTHRTLQRIPAGVKRRDFYSALPDDPAACCPKTGGSQRGRVLRRRLMWEQRHE